MIKRLIMNNRIISVIFSSFVQLLFRIIQIFVKIDRKMILINSFSGRKFDDSPKIIFEELKKDPDFKEYKFIWGFKEKRKEFPTEQVEIGTVKYLLVLAKAKYWISNSSIEQLIPLSSSKHVYINTWHGVPLKFLGKDQTKDSTLAINWYNKVKFDLLLSSGEYDNDIFHRIFPSTDNIQITGLPRNLELYKSEEDKKKTKDKLMKSLKLDTNKKTILYAPTFRASSVKDRDEMVLPFGEKVFEKLTKQYNFLIRPHYFIKKIFPSEGIIDVRDYDLNDLMILSDLLITDYSSIMFDYFILNKPVILYTYDLEEYKSNNGTYIDPEDIGLPIVENSNEIIAKIVEVFNDKSFSMRDINNKFNKDVNNSINMIKRTIQKT